MTIPVVENAACEPVVDERYRSVLRHMIQTAARRCLCTVFIIDVKTRCTTNCVGDVIDDLGDALWRGADVRVVIGGSRSTLAIAEAAAVAHAELAARGIPSRWLTSTKGVRGSHAKVVVADEDVLLGSHNWSPGAFYRQTQDSIRIASAAFAEYCVARFERDWERAQ